MHGRGSASNAPEWRVANRTWMLHVLCAAPKLVHSHGTMHVTCTTRAHHRRRPRRARRRGSARRSGDRRHHPRAHAEPGAQIPAGRPRRPQPHPLRTARRLPHPLRRSAPTISNPPSAPSRRRPCAPGAKGSASDLHRLQRAHLPEVDEGLAPPPRLAPSPCRARRRTRPALALDRLGWRRARLRRPSPLQNAPDAAIFALGGASWPRLGSDGSWQDAFAARGAEIVPLRPSNSGFLVAWSDIFKSKSAGEPLKRARFSFERRAKRAAKP